MTRLICGRVDRLSCVGRMLSVGLVGMERGISFWMMRVVVLCCRCWRMHLLGGGSWRCGWVHWCMCGSWSSGMSSPRLLVRLVDSVVMMYWGLEIVGEVDLVGC